MLLGGVHLRVHRDVGDEDGGHPSHRQHHCHPVLRHLHLVLQRVQDGDVAVHGDATEVQDGGSGKEHVVGVEEVAHGPAEDPLAAQLHAGVEGHDQDGHQQVGEGQRHDEEVGDDGAQAFELHDAADDQQVSQHRPHHDGGHDHAFESQHQRGQGVVRLRVQPAAVAQGAVRGVGGDVEHDVHHLAFLSSRHEPPTHAAVC